MAFPVVHGRIAAGLPAVGGFELQQGSELQQIRNYHSLGIATALELQQIKSPLVTLY